MKDTDKIKVQLDSEIGKLEGVILHTPGNEIENMTPENAGKALYSDILNLSVANKEYMQLKGVLSKVTQTFELKELLTEALKDDTAKEAMLDKINTHRNFEKLKAFLMEKTPEALAKILIEGLPLQVRSLTDYFEKNNYDLAPLYNFFFMRDASSAVNDSVFINKMANNIRTREALIMETIFDSHPRFITKTINPQRNHAFNEKIRMEGGDILVARKDILLIGTGVRTSSQGIDYIAQSIDSTEYPRHIIVQELPKAPDSFIHLDMVFTLVDKDKCVIYEPLIMNTSRYATIHMIVENNKIRSINEVENIPAVLNKLGMPLKPILCGGSDLQNQQREQWHSGANFFAFAPGKIVGYARNRHTIEALNNNGFEVIPAQDIITDKLNINDYEKAVVTIKGNELARGGGGARCMTMPVRRADL